MKRSSIVVGLAFTMAAGFGFVGTFGSMGCSSDAFSRRDAKPDRQERLSQETIRGAVTKTEEAYLWVREDHGKEVRLHIDARTKMDKIMPGDTVKAYVTPEGHASTVQRIDK